MDAGTIVKAAIAVARRAGYNPIASIKLNCIKCNSPVSLHEGLSEKLYYNFIHSDGKYGQCQPMDQPLACENCAGDRFRMTVRPTSFRDWLSDALSRVKASDQDPAVGFRDHETGGLFRDSTLMRASNFDDLWQAISRYVDPFGGFNSDYTFDLIFVRDIQRTRYLDKEVPGLAHFNKQTKTLTTIIKDESGNYWYSVERENTRHAA
jgi:hypothetical protein